MGLGHHITCYAQHSVTKGELVGGHWDIYPSESARGVCMGRFKKFLMKIGCAKLKASIIILGLDNTGKTTLVNTLAKDPTEGVAPTVGFNVENLKWKKIKITVLDMSGQARYQSIWEHYYAEAQGIVFVVDSADRQRLPQSKAVLQDVLSRPELKGKPLLLMCNKEDISGAIEPWEVAICLGVKDLQDRDMKVQGCSAIRNTGLEEGLAWVTQRIRKNL